MSQLGPAELLPDGETLRVTVPCTRSDILHAVDIAEDIGIAYGYNNIVKKVPTTCTTFPVRSEARSQHSHLLHVQIIEAVFSSQSRSVAVVLLRTTEDGPEP